MKRGEVWMVDFGTPSGPEQAGIRPAIILQDDQLISDLTTVVVIPITSNLKRLTIPTTFLLPAGEGGLTQDSVVLCHQIQRGKVRLKPRLGELSTERQEQAVALILDVLGA